MTEPKRPDGLMIWPDLLERERPSPDRALRYGDKVMQAVDLWLPAGPGPHRVVLMVHGGCWQSDIADRNIMAWIADDLRRRGIAVWTIDYRGVDRDGGGYPGTFLDAAAATDALRDHAEAYRLDLSKLVAVGHSAGGHLALWLAGRRGLPPASPLRSANPQPIHFVVSLGGLPDLELAATPPVRRATISVPRLAPLRVPQLLVNGNQDRIIPIAYAEDYAARMRAAGDPVEVRMVDRTGHVELIAPESAAWAVTAQAIERAFGR